MRVVLAHVVHVVEATHFGPLAAAARCAQHVHPVSVVEWIIPPNVNIVVARKVTPICLPQLEKDIVRHPRAGEVPRVAGSVHRFRSTLSR